MGRPDPSHGDDVTISLRVLLIALVIAAVIALAAYVAVKPSYGCANPDTSTTATRGSLRQMRVPEPAGAQD
jgi:hypothetical protein